MDLQIVAVGSSQLIAEEMLEATQLILGSEVRVQTVLTNEISEDRFGDLYVCGPTQLNPIMQVIPTEKIIVLNLSPTSQFFVKVSQIPDGENVYIFNNKLKYANYLAEQCKDLGITKVNFVPIAYDEMPEQEIFEKLKHAKFIIGVDKFVGDKVLLTAKYASYIRTDVMIVGAKRVASVQSACALIQWVSTLFHEDISNQIPNDESARSADTIRKAILNSVISQISPGLSVLDNEQQISSTSERSGATEHSILQIFNTLQDIYSQSSDFLQTKKNSPK